MIHFFPQPDEQIHVLKSPLCITPNNSCYGNKLLFLAMHHPFSSVVNVSDINLFMQAIILATTRISVSGY